MPASSPLTIATNAVTRLLKEEEYYRKDRDAQQKQLQELKAAQTGADADENHGFMLKQLETALAETESVLKKQPETIRAAKEKLEHALETANASDVSHADFEKAQGALSKAKEVVKEADTA